MKKRIISFAIAVVSIVLAFSVVGCSEVEMGSKVDRMIMTLEFYGADDNVVEKQVQIKLYPNLAPETVKAFKALCESGFYNGTCIYNAQSNWLEFGKFCYDEAGNLVESDAYKNAATIKGEFLKNGWKGNNLTTQRGALVMKRDYDDGSVSDKKYDTAKGAVIVALNSVSTFSSDKYCVFGMICTDDDKTNPSGSSSYDVISPIKDLAKDPDSNVIYYYDPVSVTEGSSITAGLYTKTVDEEGNTIYYKGAEIAEENLLEGDALEEFNKLFAEKYNYFYTVPYKKVVVKSIVIKK